jgi:hypothetical protein
MQEKSSSIRKNFLTFAEKIYSKKGETKTIGVRLSVYEYDYIVELMKKSDLNSLSQTVQMLIKFFLLTDNKDE